MRVSTLCRSVPLLTFALASAINAAHDAISQPYPATEDVDNYGSSNTTTDDVLPASFSHIHYRINGPGQLAVIYTEPNCPRRLGAQQLYVPGNDTDAPPELLQIEYCSARCVNLPGSIRGQSIELSLGGHIIIGERPERPYARLYETSDCRGVGKEASIRRNKNWGCTDVEDGFWHPAREGGFGSFMVWEGCRYLESEEQKEEKRRNGRLKKERERAKADIEKTRWKAVDKERKIQKEERKAERKLEKQIQKEMLKQWEEQLANEAIEMARDEEEEEILKATEVASEEKRKWANENRKRDVKGGSINRRSRGSATSESTWKWIGVDDFV